jgi:hypothetical protein
MLEGLHDRFFPGPFPGQSFRLCIRVVLLAYGPSGIEKGSPAGENEFAKRLDFDQIDAEASRVARRPDARLPR